jgi:hypothetical protein
MVKKFKAGLPSEVLPSMVDLYDAINNDRVIDVYIAIVPTPTNEPGGEVPVRKRVYHRPYTVGEMIEQLTLISKKGKDIPVYIMYPGRSKPRALPAKVLYDGRKRAAAIICNEYEYSDVFKVSAEEYHTNAVKRNALDIIEKYKLIKLMQKAVNRTVDSMTDMPSLDDIVISKKIWLSSDLTPETIGKIMNYLNEALSDGPATNTVTAQINSIKIIRNPKKINSTLLFEYTVKNV